MKCIMRMITTPNVLAFFYLTFPQTDDSYYIDASAPIIAWIAAAVVGISVALRIYWRKIRTFLSNRFQKDKDIRNGND